MLVSRRNVQSCDGTLRCKRKSWAAVLPDAHVLLKRRLGKKQACVRLRAAKDLGGDLLTLPLESVKSQLGVSGDGLSQVEAKARLGQYGFNELPEEKVNPILKFLSYFWGPIPWMIEVAAILSAVVHHWEDFGIILALLLMNVGVGFWDLKLSVAGHLTIFVTRTRRAFWSIRPAPILLAAVVGTQLIATLFAVYGIFIASIGWGWALFIWGYALA
jgi:hypothetical protein